MLLVLRFAKRRRDDRETTRDAVVSSQSMAQALAEVASIAREGERLVSISETGYH